MKNFNDHRNELTCNDLDSLYLLLSKGLRAENKDLMHRRLFNHLNMIPYYGILDRLIKENDQGWSYCAGQSYPDELRTVRKIILELK